MTALPNRGIAEPTPEELEAATAGAASEAEIAREIGTDPCGGERGVEPVRRGGFDPTIEVNGVHSGYGGPGSKTVIPCEAVAKLSMRLVPGQNPQRCFELVKEHLRARCPGGMRISFPEDSGLSSALKLPLGSPAMHLAEEVLSEMDVRGPVFRWEGASIPVVAALKETSGAAPILVGWGRERRFALGVTLHKPSGWLSAHLAASGWGARPALRRIFAPLRQFPRQFCPWHFAFYAAKRKSGLFPNIPNRRLSALMTTFGQGVYFISGTLRRRGRATSSPTACCRRNPC